jgi:hypothetical protein
MRAGVPVTPLLTASDGYTATTYPYTIGPSVEFRLSEWFVIRVDLLHKRMKEALGSREADIHRLELPVGLKYRWAHKPLQPCTGFGLSFNRIVSIQGPQVAEMRHRGTMAFVGTIGFERRWGRLRLEPELRVSHWVDRNFGVYDAPLRSNLNQLEVLAGFMF